MNLYFKTPVEGSVAKVLSGFNKELFLNLRPPGVRVDLRRFDGCKKGDLIELDLLTPFGKQVWEGKITENYESEDEAYFIDVGVKLPFPIKTWRHKHIIKRENNQTYIIDEIRFSIAGPLWGPVFYPIMWGVFKYRGPIYKRIFS